MKKTAADEPDKKGGNKSSVFAEAYSRKTSALKVKLGIEKDKISKLFDSVGVFMIAFDKNGRVTMINKKGCEILGKRKTDVIGRDWCGAYVPAPGNKKLKKILLSGMKDGHGLPEQAENQLIVKGGAVRTMSWHINLVRDDSGGIEGLIATGEDKTEIKSLNKELSLTKDRLKAVFEYATEIYFLVDNKGKIYDVNPAACSLLGYDRKEVLGKSIFDLKLIKRDQIARGVANIAKRYMGVKRKLNSVFSIYKKDGSAIEMEVVTHPVIIENTKMLLGIARDISLNVAAENSLKEKTGLSAIKALVWEMAANTEISENDMIGQLLNIIGPYMKVSRMSFNIASGGVLKCVREWCQPGVKSTLGTAMPIPFVGLMLREDVMVFDLGKVAQTVPSFLRPAASALMTEFRKSYGIETIWAFRFVIDSVVEGAFTFDINSSLKVKPAFTESKKELILEAVKIATGAISRARAEKLRRETEAKYKELYENINDAVLVHEWDPQKGQGNIVEVNDELCGMLGFKREEIIGRKLGFFTDFSGEQRKANDGLQHAGDAVFERVLVGKNKMRVPVEVKARLIDRGGKQYVLELARDLTERKIAEASIRLSEEKYRTLFENMSDGFAYHKIVTDSSGKPVDYTFLEVNRSFEKMVGLKREACIGRNISEVMPGIKDSPFNWITAYGNVAMTGKSIKFDQYEMNTNKWFSVTAYSNKQGFFATVFSDVTEKKTAEDEIRKLSTAVEQSASTVVITDLSGNIEYVNRQFEKTTGYTKQEALGNNPRILKSGYFNPHQYTELWAAITRGKDWHGEFHNRKKDGGLFWEVATISPIKDKDGNITHFIAVKDDVTEKKMAEQKLSESYEKLKELDALKNGFTSMITHELRTPMTAVKGYVSLMLGGVGGDTSPQQKEFLETIKVSSEKVLALINDMLDAAKLESGEFKVEKKPGDLTAIIEQSVKSVYSLAEKKGINIKFEGSGASKIASFDEQRISQVFVNLMSNSIKFSPEGSVIELGYEKISPDDAKLPAHAAAILKENDSVVVYVRDHGAGIEELDQAKIFNRFYQANDPEVKKHKGTGLGLSICKSITEAHGGAVWFRSEGRNKGTCFYLLVPVK